MVWHPSALRIYRALLFAYPAEFRHEYADEMEHLFAERLRAEPALGLWLAVIADVAITAPREHLHILAADLRHSGRLLARAPGFTCAALLALALGLGAATTVFSLINAVLIRALPYGEAEHLVYMWTPLPRYESIPREQGPSFADVLAWRAASRSFTAITAFRQRMLTLSDGDPVRVGGAIVLGNFFQTLNARPELGRVIDASDDRPGQDLVAVISHALWRSRFNQAPAALGKTVRLGKRDYRIVGIMPAGFGYPHQNDFPYALATLKRTEIWIPAALTPKQEADRMLSADGAIGRLRPGVALKEAQAEMSAIESHLDPLNLPEMQGTQSLLVPFIETAAGFVRPLMRLLAGAVVLVLLIACGNVANLLMARAVGRVHEMGVRTALGAPRGRLVRQLLTESLLLAAVGGGLGVLMSLALMKVLTKLNPGDIPRFDEVSVDGRVLLFALLISLGTGFVFGILPALASSRVRVTELLRQGGGRGIVGGWSRARNALIITDVALAAVLLAGAGLLIRSYLNVQGEDKGFAPSTLTMRLAVDGQSRTPQQIADVYRSVIERVAALPGVQAAGATSALPLSHAESTSTFRVDGYPNRPNQMANFREAAGDYFQAMQIRLIAGRFLSATDIAAPPSRIPPAVVVSESFAKLYFRGGNAVGGRLQRGEPGSVWSTIVGVVADVRHTNLEKPPQPTLYEQSSSADSPAIRAALPPASMISSIRKVVHDIDPTIALADVRTMRERTSEAVSRRRFQTVILASFAGIAVFLALVGVYGLLSYMVRQRTTEIGLRIALGAGQGALVGMVVRQGLMLTGTGLLIGLLGAGAAARWIASLLYGVDAFDPVTFIAVPVFMLMAAAIACFIPAWKAARIDPLSALRQQ